MCEASTHALVSEQKAAGSSTASIQGAPADFGSIGCNGGGLSRCMVAACTVSAAVPPGCMEGSSAYVSKLRPGAVCGAATSEASGHVAWLVGPLYPCPSSAQTPP